MKKKLVMIISAILTISIGVVTTVMPAFADSDINSSGELIFDDSNVEFDSADIESLQSQVERLSKGLSQEAYVSENKGTLRAGLNSKGIINYDSGKVVFDSSDLVKLADEIDNLDTGYKYEAVSALSKIDTYLKADGTIVHDKPDETISPENASKFTIAQICEGIMQSQSVAHLADRNIVPASENNLSKGCAAWVDGRLLIGSGGDNEENYNKGYEEGKASRPAAAGYFLGTRSKVESGRPYYDIAELVPEVDYTTLTTDNFIVCPCAINSNTAKITKYLSTASDVTAYCTINEADILPNIRYNNTLGRLYVDIPIISAKGGLGTSGYAKKVETTVRFCAYLVMGDIVEP
ncbi:MAG: hypothetical protein K2K46_00525 [Lachnospiraceae bacterium]|nr:hypothetical protein [Lachnospiraceae bacterium]